MEKKDWLEKNFEDTRHHLKSVAYRMLGSIGDAEDAVQEAWIRLTRSESEKIESLRRWLTTVVARVCLDTLRSRKFRNEESLDKKTSEIPSKEPKLNSSRLQMFGPRMEDFLHRLAVL
jgi:RNA polymerase sigma-70 factor, ECF subfamily